MLIGYMRVSSESDRQTTDLQRDALVNAGVDPRHLFEDKTSGARDNRLAIEQAAQKWTMPISNWKRALNRFAY